MKKLDDDAVEATRVRPVAFATKYNHKRAL
jgi:hypothetical protein